MKETLLYGCKKGQPDYMEEVLYACKGYVNKDELIKKGEAWAEKNDYDRLRVSVIDLSTPPDFTKTIK
jgi:hypothetical protein